MAHSFNPYPVVAVIKFFIIALVASAIVFFLRGFLGTQLVEILLILLWLIAIFYSLMAFLKAKFQTITLDEQTISLRSGVLSTRNIIIPYIKVTEASYTQTLLQRLMGVGNLIIDTAARGDVAIRMHDVRFKDITSILGDINSKTGKDSVV